MNAVFETACASLDWFVIINGVTSGAFNEEVQARDYFDMAVKSWKSIGATRYSISLYYWDGEKFTDTETPH